jgi:hypothetical protein
MKSEQFEGLSMAVASIDHIRGREAFTAAHSKPEASYFDERLSRREIAAAYESPGYPRRHRPDGSDPTGS